MADVQNPLFGNTPDAWASYRQNAQDSVAGIGRMPFLFSDYAGIPTDPQAAMAMFYQQKPAAPQRQTGGMKDYQNYMLMERAKNANPLMNLVQYGTENPTLEMVQKKAPLGKQFYGFGS